ncbi:Lrp/AsnC family transcriptional regulator [Pelagibius litoralis]|uniref:Lrp/AsnC family transcriptional regulator n=1 Tax=Pelagibius litoralis TaxID=374515 RepID=A0A967C4H3_9PROT|nr:Lrp/AsnC family transcriptional regulator [Pelagibius litoralis]NIA68605.1 Lrp/AsnC family transcriptional regulator [Pelagibius litoralis]
MDDLDQFDVALLDQLQRDNRQTSEALAAAVGLSATACQRRMKRLREAGYIAADVSVLDPAKVGRRTTFIVQVDLARGRADIVDGFKRDMQKIPEVQQCYYVTGEADFILVVVARDLAHYEQLTRRLFYGNNVIGKFHTQVVMDSVKLGLTIPLEV